MNDRQERLDALLSLPDPEVSLSDAAICHELRGMRVLRTEQKGPNSWRDRAYCQVIRAIRNQSQPLATTFRLHGLKGIEDSCLRAGYKLGPDMKIMLVQLLKLGRLPALDRWRARSGRTMPLRVRLGDGSLLEIFDLVPVSDARRVQGAPSGRAA